MPALISIAPLLLALGEAPVETFDAAQVGGAASPRPDATAGRSVPAPPPPPPPPPPPDPERVLETRNSGGSVVKAGPRIDPRTATQATSPVTGTATAVATETGSTVATGTAAASATGFDAGTATLLLPAAPPQQGPLGSTWESGLQQCDKDDMKIGYRFWKIVEPHKPGVLHWRVFFRVWAEDKKKAGSGWKRVAKLEYVQMTYSYPTGPSHTVTKSIPHPHKEWHNDMLADGYEWDAFTSVSIRVVRSGGSSGLQMIWPGGQCTT